MPSEPAEPLTSASEEGSGRILAEKNVVKQLEIMQVLSFAYRIYIYEYMNIKHPLNRPKISQILVVPY